ncbi:MAG: prepilin-type N-terminal cleavage/methylation domain-containing protein [Acidobacteria bacterium]|nr:MAG: prepilin-type N-terminal cleavage/methylation domain-containing protein [Acidobacteriota bacterium]
MTRIAARGPRRAAGRSLPQAGHRGFTLVELLITVAVIGIIAAIAVVNLMQALDRSRQSRTMADMRNLASAIQAYDSDVGRLPADGLTATQLVAVVGQNDLFENVTPNDGWRHPFVYRAAAGSYSLESYGKDGLDGPGDISAATRFEFERDIVLVDGGFVASPER